MDEKTLKMVAARIVLDGLRRAEVLCGEAWRQQRMADSMPEPDRSLERLSAAAKFGKAARIRHVCVMIGTAHNVGPKKNRPRVAAPTGPDEKNAMVKRRLADAR
jgi:hypothetical protein